MHDSKYILSCDIGGTHITSAIVEKSTWTIVEGTITRSHVNSLESAKSIFHDWTLNMKSCLSKFDLSISQIGIAAPGPFDYDKGVALMKDQSKYDSIYNLDVSEPIKASLGNKEMSIRYINDAAAFLQGEVYGSGMQNNDRILGITLGTGLGSAVWQKNAKAFDADLWNTPFKDSIYEEFLVTRFFVGRFEQLTGVKEKGLREILENHEHLDELSQVFAEYRNNLLSFLTFFSNKYNCRSFIIGGNIVKAWDKVFPDKSVLKKFNIEIGRYQEHAAIIGAASLFSM